MNKANEYNTVLRLLPELNANDLLKIIREAKKLLLRPDKKNNDTQSLTDLLKVGPVMNDSQYEYFKENRKYFELWRNQ